MTDISVTTALKVSTDIVMQDLIDELVMLDLFRFQSSRHARVVVGAGEALRKPPPFLGASSDEGTSESSVVDPLMRCTSL